MITIDNSQFVEFNNGTIFFQFQNVSVYEIEFNNFTWSASICPTNSIPVQINFNFVGTPVPTVAKIKNSMTATG